MAANNNIQIADLDFDSIKTNLKTFLRGQDKFKDYDFEGSGLSVLMDLLAYNTHYNAYYLNMVANEMFMDTAAIRSSVVSHAKLLNYVPKSSQTPSAFISIRCNQVNTSSVTLPKFTKFQSEAIDGRNYSFITTNSYTQNATANTVVFNDIEIVQGEPISLTFTHSSSTNPKQLFSLPDANIDTSTIVVQIQESSGSTNVETYKLVEDITGVNGSSKIYYIQEGITGNYEIYFGDGILGKSLIDGNLVLVSYVVTNGSDAAGANNFVLMDNLGSGNNIIFPITQASKGSPKESIDSIKFNAPKSYSSKNRAVTKEDYIAVLQNNKLGYSFDSINVWSGADNDPPTYGQVFISIKPAGGFTLTQTQKEKLINQVIHPVSVITVKPTILNPDYTYLVINSTVMYDQTKTTLTANQLADKIKQAIQTFADSTLNTFDSTFSMSDMITSIQNADNSIITNESDIKVQKKFFPILNTNKTYPLYFGVPLKRSVLISGIHTDPSMQYYKNDADVTLLTEVLIEEVPFTSSGLQKIDVVNPGFNYVEKPSVVIAGDGTGATAEAEVVNGFINKIRITNPGSNYTQAIVSIVNSTTDTTGTNGAAVAELEGQFGRLRSYYYNVNQNNVKTILNENIATVDYFNGIVTFNDFSPYEVNNPLGQLSLTATPASTIISSSRNRIITIDQFDNMAINVNVVTK